jgi:hypothetical protein
VDSLTASELSQKLSADLGINLPAVRLLEGTSVKQLSTAIVEEVARARAAPATPRLEMGELEHALAHLDDLTNAQVDGLLAQLLEGEDP